jgi:MoaA/NifB/PqqE/SkfB family radical SAM enzyme
MTRKKGFMSDEIFKKIVDECAAFGTPIRFIRWGEPFLHPRIIDFCEYAKSKGLPLHITNNGLVIKEHHMKSLIALQVDSIVFSFQGAAKKGYELMRNNNGYDKLKKNILKMVELRGTKEKPFIHISSTMLDETKDEVEAFTNHWRGMVDSVGCGKTNLSRLSASQIKSFEHINKIEVLKRRETIRKEHRPCKEIYQKISVDWDGKVTCCCGDFDGYLTVGDIRESSLYEVWNNGEYLKIFRKLLDDGKFRSLTLCSNCYHTYDEI